MAGIPVLLGAETVTTDNDGLFTATIPSSDTLIASGLEAMKFIAINGESTETYLLPGSEDTVEIVARRLVEPEPLCRYVDLTTNGGTEVIRFPYTNRSGTSLDVESDVLNSISSVSGLPYPISAFDSTTQDKPDGFLGFTWPASNFFDSSLGVYAGSWSLLGKTVELPANRIDIPVCASAGEGGACTEFNVDLLLDLYEQAKTTVISLSKEIVKGKKRGWLPRGDLRKRYHALMSQLLKRIRDLSNIPADSYTCQEAIQGCTTVYIPKTALLAQFDKIFKVKLPPKLRYLYKRAPKERKKFIARLRALPNQYVYCPNSVRRGN